MTELNRLPPLKKTIMRRITPVGCPYVKTGQDIIIHLKLYGDFDGSSAHELLNHLKFNSHDTKKILIHTDGLKHLHPFGMNTFFQSFRTMQNGADQIEFTGKKAPEFAIQSDFVT